MKFLLKGSFISIRTSFGQLDRSLWWILNKNISPDDIPRNKVNNNQFLPSTEANGILTNLNR